MKKRVLIGMLAACAFTLSACGTAEKPAASGAEKPKTEQKAPAKKLTAGEVLAKSAEATKKVNSYTAEMTMKQAFEIQGKKMDTSSFINMKSQENPMLGKVKIKITANGLEEQGNSANSPNSIIMDMYVTKDKAYMNSSLQKDQWTVMNISGENAGPLSEMGGTSSMNPNQQVEKLKKYARDVKMTESGNQYILTITASEKKMNEMLSDLIPNSSKMESQGAKVDIQMFKMVLGINKETFLQENFTIDTNMNLMADNNATSMEQHMTGKLTDYNKVEKFEIPKEVTENAVEAGVN